jgi:DtxR family Mn-dependent transcriptional regulator
MSRVDRKLENGGKNCLTEEMNTSDKYEEAEIDDRFELSESMENYIETIGYLEETLKVVRVKNIAKALKVKMPSVSSALGVLSKKDLVNYEKYDYVELTPRGQEVARRLRRRHENLKKFLKKILGVEEKNAEKDSCGMEHHISRNTINNIIKFMEFIEQCPQGRNSCLKNFQNYLKSDRMPDCMKSDSR